MQHTPKSAPPKTDATGKQPAARGAAVRNARHTSNITARQTMQLLADNSPGIRQFAALKQMVDNSVTQKKENSGAPFQSLTQEAIQQKANHTGMPDNLKTGIENLGGHDMSNVRVHYNSARPAQLQAHAYARGADIHIAPGQERHLPHEAWHVVQQKQGRVQPTTQLKGVNVNDNASLEKEADVMGGKALQTKTATTGHKNSAIRREDVSGVLQRISIKEDGGTFYDNTHVGGNIVDSDELDAGQKRRVNADLAGNAVLAQIRAGWTALAPLTRAFKVAGLSPATTSLGIRLYKASQNAAVALPALLDAQREWQDFLQTNNIPMGTILSLHRSFGFEYEFATWQLILPAGAPVPSHTEVGHSANFSTLFNTPFILETDSQNELELVAPPLLAGEMNGGINKAFISATHALFVAYLAQFRADNINTRANQLPFDNELGAAWNWNAAGALIKVAAQRDKWADKPNQIAYQLNIVLTPQEIAARVSAGAAVGPNEDHRAVYTTILNRFLTNATFTALAPAGRRNAIRPAIHLLAKGISNAIAIPTLTLVAQTRSPWARNDLHSYVKDLHGIWIKDSVPNITVAAVTSTQAKADLRALILALRGAGDLIPRDILTRIPAYTPQGPASTAAVQALIAQQDPAENGSTRLKLAAQAEAAACLTEVADRLNQVVPLVGVNARPAFLAENFGAGDGVRKDTYANVHSSNHSSLHLAELRSNASTDAFLH